MYPTPKPVLAEMMRIPWVRKAEAWKDADHNTPSPGGLLEALVAGLEEHPTGPWPLMRFDGPRPQIFIAVHPKGRYLVDTQGYDYARYIVALPDGY